MHKTHDKRSVCLVWAHCKRYEYPCSSLLTFSTPFKMMKQTVFRKASQLLLVMGNRLRWKTSLFRIGKRHRISSTATPPPHSGPGDNISQNHRRLLCNERSFNKNSHLWVNSGTLTSCDVTSVVLCTCCFPSESSIMLRFHRCFQPSSILIFEQEGKGKFWRGF